MTLFMMSISSTVTGTVLKPSYITTRVGADYEGGQEHAFCQADEQTGQIIYNFFKYFRPVNVPLDIFSEEIQFYELGESAITKFR